MTDRDLINRADAAKTYAYAPYSRFPVGAALECENGLIFTGCNIENAALGCTICAERVAIDKAISEGHQKFTRIAICADSEDYCYPCGTCRQVLREFSPDIEVLCTRSDGRYVSYRLYDLLPASFGREHLE